MPPAVSAERDLRLDLFRGLALWFIFLDHIPNNVASWITVRNYGFSDATEIFIFISGYTAAFVYGRAMRDRGFVVSSARILRRAWQIYVAHMFLFTIYMAQIAYVAHSFENPLYAEEMNILDFLKQPDVTIVQALLLKFKPVNMDVLPLYIVLLVLFPPLLWLLQRQATLALASLGPALHSELEIRMEFARLSERSVVFQSVRLAIAVRVRGLVRIGRCAAAGARAAFADHRHSRRRLCAVRLCIYLAIYFPQLGVYVPKWLNDALHPIDKTNLDVLRFAHFLALAALTVYFIPKDWPRLKSPVFRPAILCGQHSLEIFCLGVFLSFAGHFAHVELGRGTGLQIVISIVGILIMIATAWLISWYKEVEGRSPSARVKTPDADLAGGEA